MTETLSRVDEEEEMVPLGAVMEAVEDGIADAAREVAKRLLPTGRVLPHSLDAERALLGGILIDGAAITSALDEGLRPSDFYRRAHAVIFEAMLGLHSAGEPIDSLTVVDALQAAGRLSDAGGPKAVSDLELIIPTSAHVGAYARLVRDKAVLREVIKVARGMVEAAFAQRVRPHELLEEGQQALMEVARERSGLHVVSRKDVLSEIIDELEHGERDLIPTGFTDLDRLIGGFRPGEMVVVAARPSMGKSAWATALALNMALAQHPVAFFSGEMAAKALLKRELASVAGVDLARMARRRSGDPNAWVRLAEAFSTLSEVPIYVDDTTSPNVFELCSRARILHATHGIKAVIVDYLQRLDGRPPGENRSLEEHIEVRNVSKALCDLGRKLNIPVIALAQLNRANEQRNNKRPIMSDLGNSSRIEKDADIIIFLHREDYYRDDAGADDLSVTELIVRKNRNGPTGTVKVLFDKPRQRFVSMERDRF